MVLKEILKDINHRSDKRAGSMEIRAVTCDSRQAAAGSLFVAFRGFAQDGHDFIGAAIAGGASAVLAEKDFDAPLGVARVLVDDTRAALPIIAANLNGHPSKRLKIIGVTGTNGKTTVTYIIEEMLKAAGEDAGVIGTINYRYKGKVVSAGNTTPGPLELQGLLGEMVRANAGYAVMEVSSHSLDQGRVNGIGFDQAIFTNLTSDHLDYHKTRENYFEAKAKLFGKLKAGGTAILNYDDSMVRALRKRLKPRVITYGLSEGADIRATDVNLSLDGSTFNIRTPEGDIPVNTKLIGRHNVSNILASAAAAYCQKISFSAIKEGAEKVRFAPGRLEPVSAGQPFKVFVDFAHTQDAIFNVLGLLRDVARSGRIITVFGCGGNRDTGKRPLMGITACKLSDRVVITSDNPRHEDPQAIISQIEAGVIGAYTNYEIVADRRQAIEKALKSARPEDVVIIAGKGHEKYQLVGDTILPFDDCAVAREIITTVI